MIQLKKDRGKKTRWSQDKLGMYHFETQALSASLLLLHRLHRNATDWLTAELLTWTVDHAGNTQLDISSHHLTLLSSPLPLTTFLALPYRFAKAHIKSLTTPYQNQLWLKQKSSRRPASLLSLGAMQQWGPSHAIRAAPPSQARSYIQARNEDGQLAFRPQDPYCPFCGTPTIASPTHYITACPTTRHMLVPLHANIIQALPHVAHYLGTLSSEALAVYLLGGGETATTPTAWKIIQRESIGAVHAISQFITHHHPKPPDPN
jgi:hypothetical protein